MPRKDGTGPMGKGPMTGRGDGFCAGFTSPGYANSFGYGCGFGGNRGLRRMLYTTGLPRWARFDGQNANRVYASDADEINFLKRQANLLESQLLDIKKRLSSFDVSTEE